VAPPGIDVISISGTSPLDLVDPTSYEAVESLDYAPVRTAGAWCDVPERRGRRSRRVAGSGLAVKRSGRLAD